MTKLSFICEIRQNTDTNIYLLQLLQEYSMLTNATINYYGNYQWRANFSVGRSGNIY